MYRRAVLLLVMTFAIAIPILVAENSVEAQPQQGKGRTPVYIAGVEYHRASCYRLRGKRHSATTLWHASKQLRYRPCWSCRPPILF